MTRQQLVLLTCFHACLACVGSATEIYTIGNSLTWDTLPAQYASDWHIFCGRNIPYIFDNPNGHCQSQSLPWTTALQQNVYDFVTVQPHFSSTLTEDVAAISHWISLQPSTTTWVIHTGWTRHADHDTTFSGGFTDRMTHSPEYFVALRSELETENPLTQFRFNPAIFVLDCIAKDIANGLGPYSQLSDLYRDDIHMSRFSDGAGRYLMHNLMLQTLGLPFSDIGFDDVPANEKSYLIQKVQLFNVPEPSIPAIRCCIFGTLVALGRRRRLLRAERRIRRGIRRGVGRCQ